MTNTKNGRPATAKQNIEMTDNVCNVRIVNWF